MTESLLVGIGVILAFTALGITLWKYYPVQTKAFFRIGDKVKPQIKIEEIKKNMAKANLDSLQAGVNLLHEDLLGLHEDLMDMVKLLKQAPSGNGAKPAEAVPELTPEQRIEVLQDEIGLAMIDGDMALAESKIAEIKKLQATIPPGQAKPERTEAERKAWGERMKAARIAKQAEKLASGSGEETK